MSKRKCHGAGPRGPLTDAQSDLARQYVPLARSLAAPLKRIFFRFRDEFESAAMLGLVESARAFDPSRNIKFATFARFRIRGALADVRRVIRIDADPDDPLGPLPLAQSLGIHDEERGDCLNSTQDDPVGAAFDEADAVERLIAHLSPPHRDVCRMFFVGGLTEAQIGRDLGCSQGAVNRIKRQAIGFIADSMGPDVRAAMPPPRPRQKRNPTPTSTRETPCSS